MVTDFVEREKLGTSLGIVIEIAEDCAEIYRVYTRALYNLPLPPQRKISFLYGKTRPLGTPTCNYVSEPYASESISRLDFLLEKSFINSPTTTV